MLNGISGGLKIQGEDDSYDFGSGAGFYVDATKSPWNKGYKMYSYITSELPETVFDNFKQVDPDRVSIFGHSMGGHGALTLVSTALLTFPSFPSHPIIFIKETESAHHLTSHRTAFAHPYLPPVPQKPRQIQIRLRLRAHRQPERVPLGPESLRGLFRRGGQSAMGRARRDGAGEEVGGGAVGCAHRCGTFGPVSCPLFSLFAF